MFRNHSFFVILVVWSLIGSAVSAADNFPPLNVPADPKAEYDVLELIRRDDGLLEITTKRTGSSGVSYSKRLVDCDKMQMKYLGDGSTIEKMNASSASPRMSRLITGSSSHAASVYACRHIGQN